MYLRQKLALCWYFKIFDFISGERMKKADVDERQIHTILVTVLSTGILMWAYAFVAHFCISSPVPGIIGFVAATIHLLSPFLYRFTNSTFLISNVLLVAGFCHQSAFAYYTGGFSSNILIWFGILPMIGGITSGKRGCIVWGISTIITSLIFFILHLSDYEFPHAISKSGIIWSQALLVFGWIFISFSIVIVHSEMREHTEILLQKQGQKIDDLFRVLFHDLANPLGRIAIGLSIAKRQVPDGEISRGLEIANQATSSMMEITQNIRKMYAVSKGKANVDLTYSSLNSAIEYVQKVYGNEIEKKQISFQYNFEKHMGLNLLVEPISFNNQVLGNIISNAIKFSPRNGKIEISVKPVQQNLFAIEVLDNGIGIPSNLINHVFDLNKKTSRQGTLGEVGTGFGMHIMKSFVEMYGGQVDIESTELTENTNSGTKVRIMLKGEWG